MDCSPIIPAVRAAVQHLHRPIRHVHHHLHHAVTRHVAPVVKAVLAQACSKSTLLPLIVGGGLLAGVGPSEPFGPFGPLGEDGAPLFAPGDAEFPQASSGGPESGLQPQAFGGDTRGGFPSFPFVEAPGLFPPEPVPTDPVPLPPARPGSPLRPPASLIPADPPVIATVAEPASLGVFGAGLAALRWARRRRGTGAA